MCSDFFLSKVPEERGLFSETIGTIFTRLPNTETLKSASTKAVNSFSLAKTTHPSPLLKAELGLSRTTYAKATDAKEQKAL
jgi:hypothetical protein